MGAQSVMTVGTWSGREVRFLRDALRMSQREFAEFLGASHRAVANWDAQGIGIVPRSQWQAALDTTLANADSDVQRRFQAKVEEIKTSPTTSEVDPEPAPLGNWRSVTSVYEIDVVDPEGYSPGHVPLSGTDIAVIHGMLSALTATDHQFGGGYARRAALGFLSEVVEPRLDAPGPDAVRGPLKALAAEFQMRVAWMHLDVGDARRARASAHDAFRQAQASDDFAVCSWVMSMSALLETWLENPARAVVHAQASVVFATGGPRLVQAFAHGKLARAQASAGDRFATQEALAAARTLFETAEPADERVPASALDGYSSAYLLDEEAHCYRDLGDDRSALELSEQSLVLRGGDRFMRNRAFATSNAVLSWARLGEVERACAGAADLLYLVQALKSARVVNRLKAALETLAPYQSTRAVSDLTELVRVAGVPGLNP